MEDPYTGLLLNDCHEEINTMITHKSVQNPDCSGGYCLLWRGEVRVLPTGGDSNAILCHACYAHEITWRKGRNHDLSPDCRFDLPKWEDLEVYALQEDTKD
jgi:hypothetical protein